MKNNLKLVFFVILCGCVNQADKKNHDKKFHYTDFTICIKPEYPNSDFSYFINRKYYCSDRKNNFAYHEDRLLEEVHYEPESGGSTNTRNTSVVKYRLNQQQLDSFYVLTSRLFQLDSLSHVSDSARETCNYDGYFPEVTFTNRNLNYRTQFNYLSDKYIVNKYKDLLLYIESIKAKKVGL